MDIIVTVLSVVLPVVLFNGGFTSPSGFPDFFAVFVKTTVSPSRVTATVYPSGTSASDTLQPGLKLYLPLLHLIDQIDQFASS